MIHLVREWMDVGGKLGVDVEGNCNIRDVRSVRWAIAIFVVFVV